VTDNGISNLAKSIIFYTKKVLMQTHQDF